MRPERRPGSLFLKGLWDTGTRKARWDAHALLADGMDASDSKVTGFGLPSSRPPECAADWLAAPRHSCVDIATAHRTLR